MHKHGGKRQGAGRPKLKKSDKKEPTKIMRVPKSLVKEFEIIIQKHKEGKDYLCLFKAIGKA